LKLEREFKFDETKSEEENQKLKKEEESKYYKLIENQGYQLNNVDNELLFMCSQIIPLMDRTGRLISDIALHLSHLMSNSNLYPQLFLGYMINTGQNDSTISNSNPSISSNINHPNNNSNNSPNINTDNNPLNFYNSILNSLQQNQQTNNQTNAQNIQHSIHHQNSVHQSNTRLPNQTNLQNDLNMSQINSLLSQLSPLNNASGDNITTRNNIFAQNSSSVIDTNLFEIQSNHPRDSTPENNQNTDIKVDKKEIENLNTAKQVSEDQGSIQADQDLRKNSYADLENKDVPRKDIKLNNDSETILEKTINDDSNPRNNLRDSEKSSRKQSMNIKKFKDSLPKINLQVPAILCQGEINQAGNFVNVEPNIDIYVHTIVAPTNRTTSSSNQTSQATHTSNSNVNSSNTVNNNNIQQNNIDSNVSAESLINNLISNQRNIRTDNTSSLNQYAALLESMTSLLSKKTYLYR
jgi:hypothetical protein